jgi:hypothetical protein
LPAYVDQYRKLDKRAADAESHADDYRARAEDNRWDQCRIVHEAIESGEYSQRSFATEVGKGSTLIRRQYDAWYMYGHRVRRPSYTEAMAAVMGATPESENARKDIVKARSALRDPVLAKQVLDDAEIRRSLMSNDRVRRDLTRTAHEVDAQRAAKVARQTRESAPRHAEAREYYDAIARLTHARADVNKALDLLRGLPPLGADQREDVREILGWLSTSVEWTYEAIKARRTATLSDEIESYLEEQTA